MTAPIGRTIFGVTVWGPVPGEPGCVLSWDGPGARLQLRETRGDALARIRRTLPGVLHTDAQAQAAVDAILTATTCQRAASCRQPAGHRDGCTPPGK